MTNTKYNSKEIIKLSNHCPSNHKAIFSKINVNFSNNNIDLNSFSNIELKNGIYTIDTNKKTFKISKDGYFCYQYKNPLDSIIYNIIFKFYKINEDPYDMTCIKEYEFNINNYIDNIENKFISQMIYDTIRTIWYNFDFIIKFNIFNGLVPMLHNIINNSGNPEYIIPVFFQNNYKNAYVCTLNSGSIINIGYYKNNNDYISIGTVDVILHELTHAHCDFLFPLEYCAESGAINESIADIFSFTNKYYMGLGNIINLNNELDEKWSIGDNIIGMNNDEFNNNKDYLRVFSTKCIYPSKINQYPWFIYLYDNKGNFINTDMDCGGVHYNSCILNHFFYKCCITSGISDINKITINNLTILKDILFIIVNSVISKNNSELIIHKNYLCYQQLGFLINNYINNNLPINLNFYKNIIINTLTYSNIKGDVYIYGSQNKILDWINNYNNLFTSINKINNFKADNNEEKKNTKKKNTKKKDKKYKKKNIQILLQQY